MTRRGPWIIFTDDKAHNHSGYFFYHCFDESPVLPPRTLRIFCLPTRKLGHLTRRTVPSPAKLKRGKEILDARVVPVNRPQPPIIFNPAEQLLDRVPVSTSAPQHRVRLNQLSPTEQKTLGAWSCTHIEGAGRSMFTADYRVRAGFPPDGKD